MSKLDDDVQALKVADEVLGQKVDAAVAFVKGVPDLVARAVADAVAAGASPEVLSTLETLKSEAETHAAALDGVLNTTNTGSTGTKATVTDQGGGA